MEFSFFNSVIVKVLKEGKKKFLFNTLEKFSLTVGFFLSFFIAGEFIQDT